MSSGAKMFLVKGPRSKCHASVVKPYRTKRYENLTFSHGHAGINIRIVQEKIKEAQFHFLSNSHGAWKKA